MRIICCLSALVLCACGNHGAHSASPGQTQTPTVTARTEQGQTRLEIRTRPAQPFVLRVARDSEVAATAEPSGTEVVGSVPGTAVVVTDSYPSIPGGLSLCQAGEERFLRVVSIAQRPPRESYRVKVGSCRDNVELASPGLEWQPPATLRIHWLQAPGSARAETRTLQIRPDGSVDMQASAGEG